MAEINRFEGSAEEPEIHTPGASDTPDPGEEEPRHPDVVPGLQERVPEGQPDDRQDIIPPVDAELFKPPLPWGNQPPMSNN